MLALAVVGAVALAAALSFPVDAGNAPLVFARDSVDHQQPVEQQSPNFFYNNCGGNPTNPACDPSTWVYNPTDCDWDLDDHESWVGTGNIDANSTVAADSCQVSDGLTGYAHWEHFAARVIASTNTLAVVVTNDFGDAWTAEPVRTGNNYTYTLCQLQSRPGLYPTIPGSNGGYGFVVTYTLRITTGSRSARGVWAVYQNGRGIYSIC